MLGARSPKNRIENQDFVKKDAKDSACVIKLADIEIPLERLIDQSKNYRLQHNQNCHISYIDGCLKIKTDASINIQIKGFFAPDHIEIATMGHVHINTFGHTLRPHLGVSIVGSSIL